MQSEANVMLMIVSSSTNSKFQGRRRLLDDQLISRSLPLPGTYYDLKNFKSRYTQSYYIETSNDKNRLLSCEYILNTIQQYFSFCRNNCFLFYSGHGHTNGDWAIQTQENPNADEITLETILKLWNKNSKNYNKYLHIFMDSCFSGRWVQQIKKYRNSIKYNTSRISIFSSCQINEISREQNGGLFFNCIFDRKEKLRQNFNKMKKYQNPIYIQSSGTIKNCSYQILKQLNQDIFNAYQIYEQKRHSISQYKKKIKSYDVEPQHNNFEWIQKLRKQIQLKKQNKHQKPNIPQQETKLKQQYIFRPFNQKQRQQIVNQYKNQQYENLKYMKEQKKPNFQLKRPKNQHQRFMEFLDEQQAKYNASKYYNRR